MGKAALLGGLGFSHFAAEKPRGRCGQAARKILLCQAQVNRPPLARRVELKCSWVERGEARGRRSNAAYFTAAQHHDEQRLSLHSPQSDNSATLKR